MKLFRVPPIRITGFVTKITTDHTLPDNMVESLMKMHVSDQIDGRRRSNSIKELPQTLKKINQSCNSRALDARENSGGLQVSDVFV